MKKSIIQCYIFLCTQHYSTHIDFKFKHLPHTNFQKIRIRSEHPSISHISVVHRNKQTSLRINLFIEGHGDINEERNNKGQAYPHAGDIMAVYPAVLARVAHGNKAVDA